MKEKKINIDLKSEILKLQVKEILDEEHIIYTETTFGISINMTQIEYKITFPKDSATYRIFVGDFEVGNSYIEGEDTFGSLYDSILEITLYLGGQIPFNTYNKKKRNSTNEIYDKKFFKCVKITLEDMKRTGAPKYIEELNDIIEQQQVTLHNTSTLIQFLQHKQDYPTHYKLELDSLLAKGENFEYASGVVNQLKKEHNYMYKVLSKYFEWKYSECGLFVISLKNKGVDYVQ